ncbi:MAG: hypothetical protein K0Q81_1268 [Paenibacillus sp.]|jgi:hypothetical protein|nr:hypothetical protein [Paenibacillus sp.]
MTLWISIAAIAAVLLVGMVYSMFANKKLQRSNVDGAVNHTTTKHPILANPILLLYVLFPLAVVVVIMLYAFYYS